MQTVIEARYRATGTSTTINAMGMRPMQQRVFEKANSNYLLIKAPPASGKSRALMYVALEQLRNGLVKKVIVAVPERSIGASFTTTLLKETGFHSNWTLSRENDLCAPGGESGKVQSLIRFLTDDTDLLVCTHATLRHAFSKLGPNNFDNVLIAIDEFHHVSSSENSRLGMVLRQLISRGSARILAMTGSYFRGDAVPILDAEDEQKFDKVTYNYYEQLDGYKFLKTLNIDLSFYQGRYIESIANALDPHKKTIIHIPNVNSGESTKEKYLEVDAILDHIGRLVEVESQTGVIIMESEAGERFRVADLVNDDPIARNKISSFLRTVSKPGDLDIIIALGMAKEGFDWPFCEVALTVGYRASLTEIVQIIGRTTRDSEGKDKATFINFVAEPYANRQEIATGTNNIFKAIAASLLMEDVLAPRVGFFQNGSQQPNPSEEVEIKIEGYSPTVSSRVAEVIENDISELKAKIFQDPRLAAIALGAMPPQILHEVLVPQIIREIYPNLDDQEVSSLANYVAISTVLKKSSEFESNGEKLFKLAGSFVSVDELNLDLIKSINPFLDAFQVVSIDLDADVLKEIHASIRASRIKLTQDMASDLWPSVNAFFEKFGREPHFDSLDEYEKTLGEVLIFMRQQAIEESLS